MNIKNEKNNMKEIFEEEFGCGIMSIVDGLYTYDHNDNKLIFWNSKTNDIEYAEIMGMDVEMNMPFIDQKKKAKIVEKFTDNGEHSHWVLINEKTGDVLL